MGSRLRAGLFRVVGLASLLIAVAGCGADPEGAEKGSERTVEFCLEGEYDLAVRQQSLHPGVTERVPKTWCVVTEDHTDRVRFRSVGPSNPDIHEEYAFVFLPPDLVRIVNPKNPPDVEFQGTPSADDALRHRRIDPKRLFEELSELGESSLYDLRSPVEVTMESGRVREVRAGVDLALLGRADVVWRWDWTDEDEVMLALRVDEDLLFEGTGTWRTLDPEEAALVWQRTPGEEPIQAPPERWPSFVSMRVIDVAPKVFLVRGVRSGFQHLVVDTDQGLVIADAPAGWMELHQIPPTDLVDSLSVSWLSTQFLAFLKETFPTRPVRAVVLTHAHDDHVGGARAFVAAGGEVYAPAEVAPFLESALNVSTLRTETLTQAAGMVRVESVEGRLLLDDPFVPVELLATGPSPHASASLGVLVRNANVFFVSDLHVPRDDAEQPTAERASVECWFAKWATQNLPVGTRVINSHSGIETPLPRLEAYLESSLCRDL